MTKQNDTARNKALDEIRQINFDIPQFIRQGNEEKVKERKARKALLERQLAIYDYKVYGDKK